MKASDWANFAWTGSLLIGVLWLHVLAYRDPNRNRATVWLNNFYQHWPGQPKDESADHAHTKILEMIIVVGVIGVAILIDVTVTVLK